MQVTTEFLLTELGLLSQPLQELFVAYGKWVTNTWLKSIWEKVDKFNITVEIAPLPIRPPWEGDKWFMQAVIEAGVTNADKLVKINRFRCHQQVFVSDILDAGGKCLNKKYLKQQQDNESWSTLIFPIDKPPRGHGTLWEQILYSLAPRGCARQRVTGSSLRATRFGIGGMTRTPNVNTISRVKQWTSTPDLLSHDMQIDQTAGHNLD
jgi:hypothetical protein